MDDWVDTERTTPAKRPSDRTGISGLDGLFMFYFSKVDDLVNRWGRF